MILHASWGRRLRHFHYSDSGFFHPSWWLLFDDFTLYFGLVEKVWEDVCGGLNRWELPGRLVLFRIRVPVMQEVRFFEVAHCFGFGLDLLGRLGGGLGSRADQGRKYMLAIEHMLMAVKVGRKVFNFLPLNLILAIPGNEFKNSLTIRLPAGKQQPTNLHRVKKILAMDQSK